MAVKEIPDLNSRKLGPQIFRTQQEIIRRIPNNRKMWTRACRRQNMTYKFCCGEYSDVHTDVSPYYQRFLNFISSKLTSLCGTSFSSWDIPTLPVLPHVRNSHGLTLIFPEHFTGGCLGHVRCHIQPLWKFSRGVQQLKIVDLEIYDALNMFL